MKLTEANLKKLVAEELEAAMKEELGGFGKKEAAIPMQGVKPQDIREALEYLRDIKTLMEQLTTGMDYLNAAILGDVPVDVTKGQKLIGRMLKRHGKVGVPATAPAAKEEPSQD